MKLKLIKDGHGEQEHEGAAAMELQLQLPHELRVAAAVVPMQLLQAGVPVGAGPRRPHECPPEGQGQAQARFPSSSS